MRFDPAGIATDVTSHLVFPGYPDGNNVTALILLILTFSLLPDIFEDFVSPVNAAATVLLSSCRKRKDMLLKTMNLVMQVLNTTSEPRQRDGALHMVSNHSFGNTQVFTATYVKQ